MKRGVGFKERKDYYIYAYCDPRKSFVHSLFKYEPFYIGYGKEDRYLSHLKCKSSNLHKNRLISLIQKQGLVPIIIKLYIDLDYLKAQKLEKKLIKEFGTQTLVKGVKCGCLVNLTPGGDGGPTFFGRTHTKKRNLFMSKILKGHSVSVESRRKMSLAQQNRNIILSSSHKASLLNGLKNMSIFSRNKISKATKNTVWMYNPFTFNHRRVRLENISEYKTKGLVVGFHG
jgi:hypothetical protein